jgi:ATP synthase protein I
MAIIANLACLFHDTTMMPKNHLVTSHKLTSQMTSRNTTLSLSVDDLEPKRLTAEEIAAIMPTLLEDEAKAQKIAFQIARYQTAIALIATACVFIYSLNIQYATAILGGGIISALNSVMLAWRMSRANRPTVTDVQIAGQEHRELRKIYFYAAERFLVVMMLLALALAALKLTPLPLLGGFVIGQLVLILARLFLNKQTMNLR